MGQNNLLQKTRKVSFLFLKLVGPLLTKFIPAPDVFIFDFLEDMEAEHTATLEGCWLFL